eukprot:PhM_4_TR15005/c0_g1_i1/m.22489
MNRVPSLETHRIGSGDGSSLYNSKAKLRRHDTFITGLPPLERKASSSSFAMYRPPTTTSPSGGTKNGGATDPTPRRHISLPRRAVTPMVVGNTTARSGTPQALHSILRRGQISSRGVGGIGWKKPRRDSADDDNDDPALPSVSSLSAKQNERVDVYMHELARLDMDSGAGNSALLLLSPRSQHLINNNGVSNEEALRLIQEKLLAQQRQARELYSMTDNSVSKQTEPKRERETLMMRTKAPTSKHSVIRFEIQEKINKLRTDTNAMAEFTSTVDVLARDRVMRRRRQVQENDIGLRNIRSVGRYTPDMTVRRHKATIRDEEDRQVNAKAKREMLRAWQLERRIELLEAPIRMRAAREALTEVQTLLNAWSVMYTFAMFHTNVWLSAAAAADGAARPARARTPTDDASSAGGRTATAEGKRRVVQQMNRRQMPNNTKYGSEHARVVCTLQRVWRSLRFRIIVRRKREAIDKIQNVLQNFAEQPTLLVWARLHRFARTVKSVQRNFRRRFVMHELRFVLAGHVLDRVIRDKDKALEESVRQSTARETTMRLAKERTDLGKLSPAIRRMFLDQYVVSAEKRYRAKALDYAKACRGFDAVMRGTLHGRLLRVRVDVYDGYLLRPLHVVAASTSGPPSPTLTAHHSGTFSKNKANLNVPSNHHHHTTNPSTPTTGPTHNNGNSNHRPPVPPSSRVFPKKEEMQEVLFDMLGHVQR